MSIILISNCLYNGTYNIYGTWMENIIYDCCMCVAYTSYDRKYNRQLSLSSTLSPLLKSIAIESHDVGSHSIVCVCVFFFVIHTIYVILSLTLLKSYACTNPLQPVDILLFYIGYVCWWGHFFSLSSPLSHFSKYPCELNSIDFLWYYRCL